MIRIYHNHTLQTCADPDGGVCVCVCGGGGGQGVSDPLKNHKNTGFLSNTGSDPLKKHKATQPTFNVWPKWSFDGPLIFLPSSIKNKTKTKQKTVKVGTPLAKLSGSAHGRPTHGTVRPEFFY